MEVNEERRIGWAHLRHRLRAQFAPAEP